MANTIKIKRGSGSDPAASDMVLGEPVLRTDTAELFFKKDDGSVAKVSGGGGGPDFKYLALRNAANNGAASYPNADFTLVTSGTTTAITPAAANTLLVSVNGVIQKPNTGTSTPSQGFALSGSTIKFGANISAAPDFILYQESGGIGEPSDETVSEEKLKVSNSPVNGYFLSAQSGNTGGLTWAAPVATSCTGNSATATALATARAINGVNFDGTAAITVTAAAGTLTGNTLNSSVVTSSLTSLGDLTSLTVTGDVVIADSIIHSGDPDTKIRFPTVDTFSLETGAAERLRVDNSNTVFNEAGANIDFRIESDTKTHMFFLDAGNDRIGINTSSPTCMLQINDTATSGDGVTEILKLNGSPNNNNDGIKLQFARVGSAAGSITLQKVADNNTTDMIFGTRSFNTESETMRLTGAGKLGIGESSPDAMIHIKSADNVLATFESTDADALIEFKDNGTSDTILMGALGGDDLLLRCDAGNILFKLGNNSEKMRIDSSGNVGINITNPNEKLVVNGNSSVTGAFFITSNTSTPSAGAFLYRPASNTLAFGSNSAERMRIDSNGRLLVGHTSSQFSMKLSVAGIDGGTSSCSLSRFSNNSSPSTLLLSKSRGTSVGSYTVVQDNDQVGSIDFRGADGTDNNSKVAEIIACIDGTPGSNDMPGRLQFHTTSDGASSTTERMRIDSSGRMLLGTTTASAFTDRLLTVASSGSAGIEMRSGTSSISQLSFSDGSGNDVSGYRGFISYQHGSDLMQIGAGSAARINITSAGNVGIGTASPTDKLHVVGTALFASNTYVTGNLYLAADNKKIFAGASSDARMYHDGADSYFDSVTGNLYLYNHASGKSIFFGTEGSNRWKISDNGHFLPLTNNSFDIGNSSFRVRNIFTNDLNLSNEGGANDVDGTWGSYTIQEGEEDLFLINKRNGKKYKFNLTEVS